MAYRAASVKTKDGLILKGAISVASGKDVVIFIHGTASNFYENLFIKNISKKLKTIMPVLTTNNRGAFESGSANEKFEDSVKDIDAWIKFASSKKYKNIILMGHSLGTEKVVYYMNKGNFRRKIKSIILLGPSDSYGSQMKFLKTKNLGQKLMKEALNLVKIGNGNKLLKTTKLSHAGVLPMSASSYLNFFKENSELSKAFPIRKGKNLSTYRKIKVPILAVMGDKDTWALFSPKKELEMLRKENKRTEVNLIKNCNHDFEGKEDKLAEIVENFIEEN